LGYFEHMDLYNPPANPFPGNEPRNDWERTDRIMRMLARDPSTIGSPAADAADYAGYSSSLPPASESRRGAGTYRREYIEPEPPRDAINNLGDEMVMWAATLAGGAGRALPFAIRLGEQGTAAIRGLTPHAERAIAETAQSWMNRLGRLPMAKELIEALGLPRDVGDNQAEGLGNPFYGRTPEQIDAMMKAKGFEQRWQNPELPEQRSYHYGKADRSYHINPEPTEWKKGTEFPHVDVHRPDRFRMRSYSGPLERKRKFPLGDRLNDSE